MKDETIRFKDSEDGLDLLVQYYDDDALILIVHLPKPVKLNNLKEELKRVVDWSY